MTNHNCNSELYRYVTSTKQEIVEKAMMYLLQQIFCVVHICYYNQTHVTILNVIAKLTMSSLLLLLLSYAMLTNLFLVFDTGDVIVK